MFDCVGVYLSVRLCVSFCLSSCVSEPPCVCARGVSDPMSLCSFVCVCVHTFVLVCVFYCIGVCPRSVCVRAQCFGSNVFVCVCVCVCLYVHVFSLYVPFRIMMYISVQ